MKYIVFLSLLLLLITPVVAFAQTCNPAIIATTPDAAFTLHKDGTATHQASGLMWMRCSLGQSWDGKQCKGEATGFSWGGALQAAGKQALAGHGDWRLPSKNELETILEEMCHSPAINPRVFPATPPLYYWTSSPYSGVANGSWSIDFGFGSINASVKSGSLIVRLVRGGR